jgi:hypothetical protein
MLKIRGNKEFIRWWGHWMSRIHSNRTGPATTLPGRPRPEPGPQDKQASWEQLERSSDTAQSP